MDFFYSLWVCFKWFCFVGFCFVVLFFFFFGLEGCYFVGLLGVRYRGGIVMRISICGIVMLVCVIILGFIIIVFLVVLFVIDYWLEFKVDFGYMWLLMDDVWVFYIWYRGIFWECYFGNDIVCEYLFSGI